MFSYWLNKLGLNVAPEKIHLKRFSRFHSGRKRSFQFLGFEFYWSLGANGNSRVRRRTVSEKQKASMSEFYHWIKRNRPRSLREIIPVLRRKLIGLQNEFGPPDNSRSLCRLHKHVLRSLFGKAVW